MQCIPYVGLDDVHTPRGLSHSMPSDDSQLDALEHSVDVAAVQNSLAHMSMPHGAGKNSRRPQATSPGRCKVWMTWQGTHITSFACILHVDVHDTLHAHYMHTTCRLHAHYMSFACTLHVSIGSGTDRWDHLGARCTLSSGLHWQALKTCCCC